MKKLIEMKTVVKDGHHMYTYDKGKKTPLPDDGVVYLYINNGGMLKATEYPDRAGSVEGKFIVTDEITAEKGKPCIGGKPYDIWGIGENYVLISNKGDKFYISPNSNGSKVDHPNKRTDYFAYTLLHEIYSMLK